MSDAPAVSVVIPLYQAAATIGETLDSVAAQRCPPREVIVVDDGSTDDGAAVAAAHPLAPTVLRQANGGPAAARNAGVEAASGDLVAFLDADDLWHPDKLARQVEVFRVAPEVGLAFTHCERFSVEAGARRTWSREPYARPVALRDFLLDNRVPTLTAVAPRRVLAEVGGFDERRELIGTEDYHCWIRIAAAHPVHYVRANLASYRVHAGSLVGGEDWERIMEIGNRSVAYVLRERPELARREFNLAPRAFLRWRAAQLLRRWTQLTLAQRARLTARFCAANPMDGLF